MAPEHMRLDGEGPVATSAAWQRGEREYTPTLVHNDDAFVLPSGRPDFDARNVFQASVLDLYALPVDGHGRDQYGVLWKSGKRNPLLHGMNATRTLAAMVLANPKEVEKNLWQAIVESLQHPLIAFIMMQRGHHRNAGMRIAETREYFDGVVRYARGTFNARMQQVVHMVNARHAAYGVRDRDEGRIYPHMKRAFKYVTMLFTSRLKESLVKGGSVSAVLGSAVEDAYNNGDVWLGMREAPVDMEHFLRVEDALIEQGEDLLAQEDPLLLSGLKRAAHRTGVDALAAAAKRQGVSNETLAQRFSDTTRERLGV